MNRQNIWNRLAREYKEYSRGFGGGVSSKSIDSLEEVLNVKLPNSYKTFIKNYGSGLFAGHIVYGLVPLSLMGNNATNIVDKTNFYKNYQKWPNIEDWIIISDDGSGNPIGLKPDGSVWLSDHDSNFEQIKLADNFEDFLEKLLDETLYE